MAEQGARKKSGSVDTLALDDSAAEIDSPAPQSVTLDEPGVPTESAPNPHRHPLPDKERELVVPPDAYDIVREYARGGLGRVLEARDRRLDRIVAIKELQRDHPIARARFAREVRITARLQHPNIVPIHEAGRWPSGASFYSMKLVEGQTLAEAVARRRTPSERFGLLPAVVDVTRAVAYAHSQRIIHRDLKPANVLVGPFGETVVIDWGLAKHLDDASEESRENLEDLDDDSALSTRLGAVVGTPAFMPPEQAAGEPVDERADVYAIGAILYHVISGRSPYDDVAQGDVLDRVVDAPPIQLEDLAPDTPPDLLAIVDKAMARKAKDRYPSAQTLLDELERYASGRLVDAYRYRLSDLLRRFVGRYRAAVFTAAMALVVVVSIAALFVVELAQQSDAAQRSAEAERTARAEAERRVDQLLVVKARALLDRDPTAAVAWLKNLKRIPSGAATVAGQAQDRGVARRVLRGHTDLVWAVAVAPDGRHVASASQDKTVRVWERDTGKVTVLSGHSERVTSVVFAPAGSRLASASYDGTVRMYEVESGGEGVLGKLDAPIKAIAFAPDGQSIAAVSEAGTVAVFGMDGVRRAHFVETADRNVFASFSADGRWLLTGSHHGAVRVWDLSDGNHKLLEGHAAPVMSSSIAPDGRSAVTAGEDGVLLLWDLVNDTSERLFEGPVAMRATAFSPDSMAVAAASQDGAVRLWRLSERRGVVVATHGERVEQLAFSPDGRRLASAGWDKTVRVVDLRTNATRALLGHADVVVSIAFSGDGSVLVSGSWDKTLRTWPLESYPTERTFRGHDVGVRSVAVSPRGTWIASGGHDDTVRLWRPDGSDARVFRGHRDHVYRVLFSPDGRLVASSSDDLTVRLWSVPTGESRMLEGHQADVEELAFSKDGRFLASASEDDTARLWPVAGGPAKVLQHENDVTALDFAPTSDRLVTSSRDRAVRTWSVPKGVLLETMREHPDEVRAVIYSPDGTRIASASVDGSVIVRPARGGEAHVFTGLYGARVLAFSADGSQLAVAGVAPRAWVCAVTRGTCRELNGHRALVRDLVFMPGRDLLVSASGDATVQIWDLETDERRILEGHAAPVFDLEPFPNGDYVVSAGGDAVVQMWPVRPPPDAGALRAFLDELTTETVEEADVESGVR